MKTQSVKSHKEKDTPWKCRLESLHPNDATDNEPCETWKVACEM